MATELFGEGCILITLMIVSVALYEALKARNLSGALTAIGKLWNPDNREVTKIDDLPSSARKVVAENADAILMTGILKHQITGGLVESRKAEILQIINDNENDGIPGDSYFIEIPEKGVRYEIFAGKIRNIVEMTNCKAEEGEE